MLHKSQPALRYYRFQKGPHINYVASVVAPKTIYYIDFTYKKDNKGGGGAQKLPILG